MEAILYKELLIKEFFYGLLFKGAAGLIVFIEAGHIPKNWFYLAIFIILLFPASTYLLNILKKNQPKSPAWALMVISFVKMLLLPILLFVLFDKEHDDIEAFVIPAIITYLIMLALDTKWKIKWLFGKKHRF